MPKVYVTNYNGNYDYSKAEAFGELINMTQGFIPSHRYDVTIRTFENYAKTASDEDYLLLSGSNLVCGLAVAAWLKHRKSCHLLQHGKSWDESKNSIPTYLAYHVTVDN
jgi:hypothetical protein